MGGTRLTEHYGSFTARRKAVWYIYGPSEGRTVYFTDYRQDLRPA